MDIDLLTKLYIGLKRPNTQRNYYSAYRQFTEFLNVKKQTIETATLEATVEFFVELREKSASATFNNRLDALSSIFNYLQDEGAIQDNVIRRVKRALPGPEEYQVRPTKLIEFKRIRPLLESIERNTPSRIQEAALIALLFGSALRRSEALALNIQDIMTTPYEGDDDVIQFIRIRRAKGRTGRDVAMPEWAWEYFSELVSQRKSEGGSGGDPVFVNYFHRSRSGQRISESTLYRIYKKHLGAAPHSARATAVTALLSQGYSRDQVKNILGHKSDKMVNVYDKRLVTVRDSVARNLRY